MYNKKGVYPFLFDFLPSAKPLIKLVIIIKIIMVILDVLIFSRFPRDKNKDRINIVIKGIIIIFKYFNIVLIKIT